MDRHALPIIVKELKPDEIVRITADDESFNELVDRVVLFQAQEALADSFSKGYLPSPQELMMEIESAKTRLRSGDMFIKSLKKIMAEELDTQVYITNEDLDVAVTVQNLLTMLQAAPEYRDAIIKQTFDLMGLSQPQLPQNTNFTPPPMPGMGQPGGAPQGAPQPQQGLLSGQQMQQISTSALTGGAGAVAPMR